MKLGKFFNANTLDPRRFINRLSFLKSYLKSLTIATNFPIEIGIELTNRCNLECVMCNRLDMHRPVGDMSLEMAKGIIDEVKKLVELVYLHGTGEPMLHPDLAKIVEYCSKAGVKTGLSTNCTLLSTDRAKELLEAGLDYILMAIDGVSQETYTKIRKKGNYKEVEENVLNFLSLKEKLKAKTYVLIQCIHTPENHYEIPLFRAKWSSTNADSVRIRPEIDFLRRGGVKTPRSIHQYPCIYIWRSINIYHNGMVVPCCADYDGKYPLGNVHNDSLLKIWNDIPMQELRKAHIENQAHQIVLCRDCPYPQPRYPFSLFASFLDGLTIKKSLPNLEIFLTE